RRRWSDMTARTDPRTYLFVPGNRPDRFAKALASGADAVVLDLEDAVAADAKDAAREAVRAWVTQVAPADRARVVVRVNDLGSPHAAADLAAVADTGLPAVMLPKTESAADVATVRSAAPGVAVLALVESARGVAAADEIAGALGVVRLVFGTLDYALDLDLELEDASDGLSYAADRLAVASRCARIATPVGGVTPQLGDEPRLLADLAWSRRHGFGAKLCIHPAQVAPIHAALAPTREAVERARRVLDADAASPGAARLDGRMIDRPVVLAARRTLTRATH
ncbi:MAG: citrate lyase subunit beta / citryl-CoA lyase, partial [Pseudonocardiales bacterium]|nr:citrate lyase subunit beta / citryl-CoA lyase [Pseudonocardiales bacterium]